MCKYLYLLYAMKGIRHCNIYVAIYMKVLKIDRWKLYVCKYRSKYLCKYEGNVLSYWCKFIYVYIVRCISVYVCKHVSRNGERSMQCMLLNKDACKHEVKY